MTYFKIFLALLIPGGLRELAKEINEITEGGELA